MSAKSTKAKKSQTVKPSPVSDVSAEYPAASLVLPPLTVNPDGLPIAITGGVEIDMKVSASDVADLAVNRIEDLLLGRKQDVDSVLRMLRSELAGVQKSLKEASDSQAVAYVNKNAAALAKALHNFLGEPYEVQVKANGLDVEAAEVSTEVAIIAVSDVEKKDSFRRSHPVISQDYKLPANETVRSQIVKLSELTEKIREQEKQLESIRRHLADLPRYARKAKSQLTKLALSGTPLTGPSILSTLDELTAAASLSLPAPN